MHLVRLSAEVGYEVFGLTFTSMFMAQQTSAVTLRQNIGQDAGIACQKLSPLRRCLSFEQNFRSQSRGVFSF